MKDIRKFAYEFYLDHLFNHYDLESFIKEEIEGKGIIVIDEIDKIVRSGE